MKSGRREFLAGSCVIVAAAFSGSATRAAAWPLAPSGARLFLRSAALDGQGAASRYFGKDAVRSSNEQVVDVRTPAEFYNVAALLDRTKGERLAALLTTSDELVIDMLLTRRGARERTRHCTDSGALLLTARL